MDEAQHVLRVQEWVEAGVVNHIESSFLYLDWVLAREIQIRFTRASNKVRYGVEDPSGGSYPQSFPLDVQKRTVSQAIRHYRKDERKI